MVGLGACVVVWVGEGACGVCAGRGGEKVSLAALLSGYLGKSGHLPRFESKKFSFWEGLFYFSPLCNVKKSVILSRPLLNS